MREVSVSCDADIKNAYYTLAARGMEICSMKNQKTSNA